MTAAGVVDDSVSVDVDSTAIDGDRFVASDSTTTEPGTGCVARATSHSRESPSCIVVTGAATVGSDPLGKHAMFTPGTSLSTIVYAKSTRTGEYTASLADAETTNTEKRRVRVP